jgi:UPF0755 protein
MSEEQDTSLPEDGGNGPGVGRPALEARGRSRAAGGVAGAISRHPVRALLGLLAVVVLGFLAWSAAWYEAQVGGSAAGARSVVMVRQGTSVSGVVGQLARQRVVSSGLAFRIYLVLHGTPVVRAGSYLLHSHEPFASLRSALASGPDVFDLTVPPGFTVEETASRVGQLPGHDAGAFSSVASSGTVRSPLEPVGSTNLDGLLGTGTYLVLPGESDATLLEQMVGRFDAQVDLPELQEEASSLGITPYQAVTVASIVQKEGVYPENLAKVARVIYNRLAKGMDLQMDSTVLYSLHRDGGPVTPADLALDTPYNTYLHPGLTPTPICFPSQASVRAALAPATGDWLYFVVVTKDGVEAFSDTLAAQDANEQLAKSRGLP